jgi:hypothetical protein
MWPPAVYDLHFTGMSWGGPDVDDGDWPYKNSWEEEDGSWKLVADRTAPTGGVLAQSVLTRPPPWSFLKRLRSSIHLCLAPGHTCKNIELQIAIKAVKGQIDQGGGAVWRYRGIGYYYVAGINPLDDSLRLYKVIDRKPVELGCATGLQLRTAEWHTLTVKHIYTTIECSLDGVKRLEIKDDSISNAGAFGSWVKGDAETYFDALRVTDFGH